MAFMAINPMFVLGEEYGISRVKVPVKLHTVLPYVPKRLTSLERYKDAYKQSFDKRGEAAAQ